MQFFIQFMSLWAYLYFLAMGFHYVLGFLAKKNIFIKTIAPYLISISTGIHELAHHIMAKLTGADAKLENIDFKKGTYTYLEKDKTLLKSLMVSLAPSILGSILIYEIIRFIKLTQNYPFWVYVVLNLLILFIFLGLPSSSADFYLILKTFSENPVNFIATIIKSAISIGIIIVSYQNIAQFVPIRTPYMEILSFGIIYLLLRICAVVIPIKIYKKSKKKNQKRLLTKGPRVFSASKIRNPKYYINETETETETKTETETGRSPKNEFESNGALLESDNIKLEFEKLEQNIRKAATLEDENLTMYLLSHPDQGFLYFHKGHEKLSNNDLIFKNILKIQSYVHSKEKEIESLYKNKKQQPKANDDLVLFLEIGMYLAALNRILQYDSTKITIPSELLLQIYSESVENINLQALKNELKSLAHCT